MENINIIDLKKTKIAIFGDSVSKGIVYDDIKKKYRKVKKNFVDIISESKGLVIDNLSKFGCTVSKGIEIFRKNVDKIKNCSIVVLEFGGNDCNFKWSEIARDPYAEHESAVPPERFREEYERLIKAVKAANCVPVLLSLPPIDYLRFFEWVSQGLSRENILKFLGNKDFIYRWHEMYNDIIFDLAQRESVMVLDIRRIFLSNRNIQDYICTDGMHPNEKGHELISKALLDCGLIPDL